MISKLVNRIIKSPGVRNKFYKPFYNYLAKRFKHADYWTFMNFGYSNQNGSKNGNELLDLEEIDEGNRYCIQMYHLVANVMNLEGLNVLEVGSGRGGGAHYVKKYLKPENMTGLDISNRVIEFCNENHKTNGLEYIEGTSEDLPFPDDSFDLVINVESSHAYGSVEKFLNEVKRVLKPGGTFSITDVRTKARIGKLKDQLVNSGLELSQETDISKNVVEAMELDNERKLSQIKGGVSGLFRWPFKQFAGITGSYFYNSLKTGSRIYKHYVLVKPELNK